MSGEKPNVGRAGRNTIEAGLTDAHLILLADIGGTYARFALLTDGTIGPVARLTVADHPNAIEAIHDFLAARPAGRSISAAVLGVAGTVNYNLCQVTNSRWLIDAERLRSRLGFKVVHLLNDFEALAWAVPHLRRADLFSLYAGQAIAGAPKLLIGPGTGFGVSCLLTHGDAPIAVASEAGHSTLPAASQREVAVIDHLRERFGHVSIERCVSGPGLENIYEALTTIDSVSVPPRDTVAITTAALQSCCGTSRAALDMFCGMLGTVAGNLALTFCARGGVYIGGGIAPRFPDYLAHSEFAARYEAKGRYRPYLQGIPINLIVQPDATFVGLKAFAGAQRL